MAFRFLPNEISEMEEILRNNNMAPPPKRVCESVALKFNTERAKTSSALLTGKQVMSWFQNRKTKLLQKGTPTSVKLNEAPLPSHPVDMEFEAQSQKDQAWYDVEKFHKYRTNEKGEPEVLIQYASYGMEEAEWLNPKTQIRQRSIPCESHECIAIMPNDLVLCFREGQAEALYVDADVMDVQRRRHDVRGCRCRFWIRYRVDGAEEVVPLRKICRRPETTARLKAAQEAMAKARMASQTVVLNQSNLPPQKDMMDIDPK